MAANSGQRSFEIPDANMLGTLKYITAHCPLRSGPITRRSNASAAGRTLDGFAVKPPQRTTETKDTDRRSLRSGDKSGQADLEPGKNRERSGHRAKTAVAGSCSKSAVARRFRASHTASAPPVRHSTSGNRLSKSARAGNATLSAKRNG